MDSLKIIDKYYKKDSKAYHYIVLHSSMDASKSVEIAYQLTKLLKLNIKFIEEAAMLHDIGAIMTNTPEIGCNGTKPYICHGYLGREMLEREGLPNHAMVCERHVGTGITMDEIIAKKLPLPSRDMIPISIEEQIICYADKFYSKRKGSLTQELPIEEIKANLKKYGEEKLLSFDYWSNLFSESISNI